LLLLSHVESFAVYSKKSETATKWVQLTNKMHAVEITLFCVLLLTACIRRIRSTGHSALLLLPYVMSVVAVDVADLAIFSPETVFPAFIAPIAGPLVAGSKLLHVLLTYAVPAGECTRIHTACHISFL
jgi:hypothetical protein